MASIIIKKGAESPEISEGLRLLIERDLGKLVEEIRVRGIEARSREGLYPRRVKVNSISALGCLEIN